MQTRTRVGSRQLPVQVGHRNDISSIDGIDFQETILPFLTHTISLLDAGGNETGTWQAILADGTLGLPVAFSAASAYANTGVNIGRQNAYGVVFTTDVSKPFLCPGWDRRNGQEHGNN